MGAAGGVEDHDVVAAELGRLHGAPGDLRPALWPATIGSVSTPTCWPSMASCSMRGRAARVERGHQDLAAFWRSVSRLAILAVVVVLPEPCRPTIMMATGGGASRSIGSASAPSISTSVVMDDLDDHLAGLDRLDHLRADGLVAHLVGEGAHDLKRDVGLEQRAPHLAQRRVDILLRQRATARELVENA